MDWISVIFWLLGTLIVVLGPIILIHELGHFVFAKLAGARVEEFGFGFPPRILRMWYGEGSLTIGGLQAAIPRRRRRLPELKKGDWADATLRARDDGTYILQHLNPLDTDGDAPEARQEQANGHVRVCGELTVFEPGTLYSLNLMPMGAFVKITGEEDPSDSRSLAAQPKRWRLAVLLAGAVLNILVAVILLASAYVSGIPEASLARITEVIPGTAAEQAGLEAQDVVLTAGGERIVTGTLHLNSIIRAAPEQPLELVVLREGETLTITAEPRLGEEGYGFLGIWMETWPDKATLRHYSLPEAVGASISDLGMIVRLLAQVPIRLIRGTMTPEEARPASLVGASQLLTFSLQQSIAWGMAFPVLQTAALISLALGITNLLPIPAFDGGRVLFVLIEAVRGRRISPEREAAIHFVGLVIMMILMLFIILQDIINPIIPWSELK